MAHFAELDENNVVIKIHHVHNDDITDEHGVCHDHLGLEHCCNCMGHENFVQCSINHNIRGRYPKLGDHYDPELDAFITEKPYEHYILDTNTFEWIPPTPKPQETDEYNWIWVDSVYFSDGDGWVKDPKLSEYQLKRGCYTTYNQTLKKFEIVTPPINQVVTFTYIKSKEEVLSYLGEEHSQNICNLANTDVIEDIDWDIITEYIYMNDLMQ